MSKRKPSPLPTPDAVRARGMRGVVGYASKYDECPYCLGDRIDGPAGFVEVFVAPYAKTGEESRRKGAWVRATNQPRALAECFRMMNAILGDDTRDDKTEGAAVKRIAKRGPRAIPALKAAFAKKKGRAR